MPSKRFQPGTATLEELFGGSSPLMRVPRYQRRYAWNHKQEVVQLWQDLLDAVERDAEEYFLGTLVLDHASQPGILELIDGQQRLATLTMVLAGLRNKLATLGTSLGSASQASSRLHQLIMRTDLLGQPKDGVLTLGVYDQESFRRYIQLRPGDPGHLALDAVIQQGRPGRPPTNRVKEAFKQITESIDSLTDNHSSDDQVRRLAKLAEYILGRITHITITVTDDTDAFTLFETVNYRGLDLSTADLLKNHLFGLANSEQEIETLTGLWTDIVSTLEDSQLTRFLRYVWLSRQRHVTEKELYPRIKEYIKANGVDPRDFLGDLNNDASSFAALVAPKDEDPSAFELRDLFTMRMTQGVPFLMAAKDCLDDGGFRRAVNLVEVVSIRNTLVGKRNPNELERRLGDWARQIRAGAPISDLEVEAREVCVPDDEFKAGFNELGELSSAQARYLLRKIQWFKDTETQLAPSGVDLEHVLPQSPDKQWISYMGGTDEEVLAASQKLGNLTLLSERLNKRAAAKPFADKRDKFYSKSKIGMSLELSSYQQWGYQEIADRQASFAEKAVDVWHV